MASKKVLPLASNYTGLSFFGLTIRAIHDIRRGRIDSAAVSEPAERIEKQGL
jgi:hypothetical protein